MASVASVVFMSFEVPLLSNHCGDDTAARAERGSAAFACSREPKGAITSAVSVGAG